MDAPISGLKPKNNRKEKQELDSRSFKDGAIYLFRRADYKKPTWFCRVKVPNAKGYVSCSTKTTDEHQAFAFANDLFHKTLVSVANGKDLRLKTCVETKVTVPRYSRSFIQERSIADRRIEGLGQQRQITDCMNSALPSSRWS